MSMVVLVSLFVLILSSLSLTVSLYLSTADQCDKIWRNLATFANLKSLEKNVGIFSMFQNFGNLLMSWG